MMECLALGFFLIYFVGLAVLLFQPKQGAAQQASALSSAILAVHWWKCAPVGMDTLCNRTELRVKVSLSYL